MSAPIPQAASDLLNELFKHYWLREQNNLIEKFSPDWYAHGKLDGVEEYTTGKLKGEIP